LLHHSSIHPSSVVGGFLAGADLCFCFGEPSLPPLRSMVSSRVVSSAMLTANSAPWAASSTLSIATDSADCPPSELTPALSLDLAGTLEL
uniref:Uncharacterized protein n=1 Tax=Romanomermis culicivorax TaxID=13658 RepID=A0A915I963_ROMCU